MIDKIKTNENYIFNPFFSDEAKLEVNVNQHGVSFVANAEGYLALSRFFTYLAETHMSIRRELVNEDNKNYIFSPGPIKQLGTADNVQDVLFWISDKIGPEFWKDMNESSPTKEWVEQAKKFVFDSL